MKIEDCEVGMKVKNCWDGEIEKRDKKGIISNIGSDYINFKGRGDIKFYPEYFEPVNKFEVDEKVIFNKQFKGEVLVYDDEIESTPYAVKIKTKNGYSLVKARESQLTKPKNKDNLEIGDKFMAIDGVKCKILAVGYDKFYKRVDYYVETLNGEFAGKLLSITSNNVEEIIYD